MILRRLSDAGDTIVEVLLAMVVIGAVLVGAYVSSNHSLNTNRAAQERGEALKYAEAQVELVKSNVNALEPIHAGYYCLDNLGNRTDFTPTPPPANLKNDDYSTYKPACAVGDDSRYHISVNQSSANTYRVRVRWDRIGGNDKDEIIIYYRVLKS